MSEKIFNFGSKDASYIMGGSFILFPLLNLLSEIDLNKISGSLFISIFFVLGAYLFGLLVKEIFSFTPLVQQRAPNYNRFNKFLYCAFEGTDSCPEKTATNTTLIEFYKNANERDLNYVNRIVQVMSVEHCVGTCMLVSTIPWYFTSFQFDRCCVTILMVAFSFCFLSLAWVKNIQRHIYICELVENYPGKSPTSSRS